MSHSNLWPANMYAKGTGTVYRTTKYPMHDLAKNHPFTNRELQFALEHHKDYNSNQARYRYYREDKHYAFLSVSSVCARVQLGKIKLHEAHQEHSNTMSKLGLEKAAEPKHEATDSDASGFEIDLSTSSRGRRLPRKRHRRSGDNRTHRRGSRG